MFDIKERLFTHKISLFKTIIIGIGSTIGGGIFLLLAPGVKIAGPGIILAFVFNAVIALIIAGNYAEGASFKQLLVQNFYPNDERMHDIYKLVVDRGKWITFHAGTGPYHNQYVGYKNFKKFIEKYPNVNVIVAHLGFFETHKFFNLLDKYNNLYLDTAMVYLPKTFSKKWKENIEFPTEEELLSHEDRILFGSDFPVISYDYSCSIEGLLNLNLSKSFYQKIFYENAKRIFKVN